MAGEAIGLTELGRMLAQQVPAIGVLVLVVLATIKIVGILNGVKEAITDLKGSRDRELEWRKEHEKYTHDKLDEVREMSTNALLLQRDVQSLAESMRFLRDAHLESLKYGGAAMTVLVNAERAGLLKIPPA